MWVIVLAIFTAESYRIEVIGNEAGLRFGSDSSTIQVPLSYGGMDRIPVEGKYGIAGWFAFEQLGAAMYDTVGMVEPHTQTWIPCVTITTDSKVTVLYANEQLEFDFTIQKLEWYFISAWVNMADGKYGIWIGAYDSQISTQCTQKNYSGQMIFDRSQDYVYLGHVVSGNENMSVQVFDVFAETAPIDNESKLEAKKSSYSCHSYCSSETCHGPSNYDCDEFIQVTDPFYPHLVQNAESFDSDKSLFGLRDDYGLDSTWVGWIDEFSINQTGNSTHIFSTRTQDCSTCTQTSVFYSNADTGNRINDGLNIIYGTVENGAFQNPSTLVGNTTNLYRLYSQVFVGASFESSTNSMTLCWGLPGDESPTWNTETGSSWTKWPAPNETNRMILGDDGNNHIDAEYRSVRYYHKSSHAGSNLADLLQNLENPYSPRCISWNDDGCNACANGYYLSVSLLWDIDSSSWVGVYWNAHTDSYEYSSSGLDPDFDSNDHSDFSDGLFDDLDISLMCFACHPFWETCTGPSDIDCITCGQDEDGNQLLLLDGWCTSSCPTGTVLSGNECTYANAEKICEFQFSTLSASDQTFSDSINSIPAVIGLTSNVEGSDPIVVNQRGLHFGGSDDLLTIDSDVTKVLRLPTQWEIFWWGRYELEGHIFGRYNDDDIKLFSVHADFDSDEIMACITSDETTQTTISSISLDVPRWVLSGLLCDYDSYIKATYCNISLDAAPGTLVMFTSSNTAILLDNPNNRFVFGSDPTQIEDAMEGFIYNFQIFINPDESVQQQVYGDSTTCAGCSLCPASIHTCLSLWELYQYIESDGSCGSCSVDEECQGTCASSADWVCQGYIQDGACVSVCDSTGYYTDEINKLCTNCPTHCDVCSTSSACTTCKQNYVKDSTGHCVENCANGQFNNNGTCQSCPSNCDVCSTSQACNTCKQSYVKDSTDHCVVNCANGQFNNNGTCQPCPSNCDVCSTSQACTTCKQSYVKDSTDHCVVNCANGQFNNNGTCQSCPSNCDVCSTSQACTTCKQTYVKDSTDYCVQNCANGQFNNNGTCQSCPSDCDVCSSTATCNTCTSPYVKDSHSQCVENCANGYFNNIGSCQSCPSHCDVCSSTSTCTTCTENYVTDSNEQCVSICDNGQFNNNGTCQSCPSNCDVCSTSSACTTCKSNYVKDSNNLCIESCSNGQFNDGSGVCVSCPQNCDACSSSTAWTTCASSHFLRDDEQCHTSCQDGWFDNGIGVCVACSSNCQTCSSSSVCTVCTSPYVLRDDAECYTSCQDGWFANGNRVCEACPSNCDACSSSSVCSACTSPYFLRDDGECHTSCQDGWFDTGSRVCAQCHGSCATCTAAEYDKCLTCATGLSKIDSSLTTPSACDCSSTSNASKEAKLACLSNTTSTDSESSTTEVTAVLNEIEEILLSEDLTVEEFDQVFSSIAEQPLVTAEEEQKAIEIMVTGGLNAIKNAEATSLSITSEKFDAQFQKESQNNLQGAQVTTPTGSGVVIPLDLVGQNIVSPDANLIVNVVHMKASNTTGGLNENQDVISVSINELLDDGSDVPVVYENLSTNFTIILANQSYNATETFEWVYLKANELTNENEWSTDGCVLNSLDSGRSECSCNHLTEFSIRKATDGAQTPNNAAATTEFSNAADFSLETNSTPLIVILVIQALWWPVFILLRRADLKKYPEEDVGDRVRNAFARAFGLHSRTQTQSFDDRHIPNMSSDALSSYAKPADDAMQNKVTTIRPNVQENVFDHVTFRNETENENEPPIVVARGSTKQLDEPVEEMANQMSLKHRFFQRFKLIGVFINGGDEILRSELWAIFLTLVMISIFVTGMFYQDDTADGEEDEDKTFWETIQAFTWQDFWIILYSVSITVPIPFILRFFFRRKKLDNTKDIISQLRTRQYKRCIGYTLVFLIVAWCSWSCIAFSLAFGYNATQRWMLTFGLSEAFDLSIKDPLVAIFLILARVMYGFIRDRHSKISVVEPSTAHTFDMEGQHTADKFNMEGPRTAGQLDIQASSTAEKLVSEGPRTVEKHDIEELRTADKLGINGSRRADTVDIEVISVDDAIEWSVVSA